MSGQEAYEQYRSAKKVYHDGQPLPAWESLSPLSQDVWDVVAAEPATMPICWYCKRPGHDETEISCPDRQVDAQWWRAAGNLWRGKEGA